MHKNTLKYLSFVFIAIFAIVMVNAQAPLKKPKPPVKKEQTSKKTKESSNSKSKTSSAKLSPADGTVNGYNYVDLGLPSGVKWATCNVGASKPEDYGKYFAWGETNEKKRYTWNNCSSYRKNIKWLLSNDYIDIANNLTMEHDAARQNMGGLWRMPTKKEIEELIVNTSTEWTTINGVNGRLIKSNINSKRIFLPASGWFYDSNCTVRGMSSYYWSATPNENSADCAYCLYCVYDSELDCGIYGDRSFGRPIRAVLE